MLVLKKTSWSLQSRQIEHSTYLNICTCKDAIQCRTPPPPPIYVIPANRVQIYLPFWKDKLLYLVSHFFRPLFWQKTKNVPKCGVVALFMRDYSYSYTEEVWSCREWGFFQLLKILKIDPFMIKNQNPVFF